MTAPDQASARAHYEAIGDHRGYLDLCKENGWTADIPTTRNDPETGHSMGEN